METILIIAFMADMLLLFAGFGIFAFAWFEQDTRKSILLGMVALTFCISSIL